jgi:uncharacterized protein YbjT (DUF2867 family)
VSDYLVIGRAGLVGSHVVDALVARNEAVRVLVHTDHSAYDLAWLTRHARQVVAARNAHDRAAGHAECG